jgi:branched-chain amino acid transport system permease protein
VAYLPERFRALSDWRLLIFGVSLMLIVYFRPQGLLPPRRTRRAIQAQAEIQELEEGETVDA